MSHKDLIQTLETTGDYRVLRRLHSRTHYHEPDGTNTKLAIFLDLETTGLDPDRNEIIEIAMVPFEYSSDGKIFTVHEAFSQFQEPKSGTIPKEITRITGITNDMVRGKNIDGEKVAEIASSAALIIAHNAGFDRKFAEKAFEVFSTKAWACTMTQIRWAEESFESTKLEYLAMKSGFFYDAHRATVDCHAAIELLSKPLPKSGTLALKALLDEARKSTCRIWAEGSPFDFKDILKLRGYRWNAGDNGKPRSWYRDVPEDDQAEELAYLRKNIYQREVDIPVVKTTAYDRFSNRV